MPSENHKLKRNGGQFYAKINLFWKQFIDLNLFLDDNWYLFTLFADGCLSIAWMIYPVCSMIWKNWKKCKFEIDE